MRAINPRSSFGQRKADLFNERFAVGSLVAVRRTPGEPATWDRVFAPAYGAGDGAMVELASSLKPVDTDIVMAMEPAIERCPEARSTKVWALACAYALGFATAVILALVQPVRTTTPTLHVPEITSDAGETV